MESHDEKIYMLIVEGQRGGANANYYFEQATELISQYYNSIIIRSIIRYSNRDRSKRGTLPTADIEEIAQEILISVYRSLPTYPGNETGLKPWILRIAVRRVADYYRSRKSLDSLEELQEPIEDPQASSPEEIVAEAEEARLQKDLIDRALAKLPWRYRMAIRLRFQERLSPQALASVLDTSIENVRTIHSRAIIRLSEAVKKLEQEGRDDAR